MRVVALIISTFILFSGCQKHQLNDCYSGAGDRVSHMRPLNNFNKITISDRFSLVLVPDTAHFVVITGGENLMPGISTEINEGGLFIENQNTCNFVRSFDQDLIVEVHVSELNELNVFADVSVRTKDTLKGSSLSLYSESLNDLSLTIEYDEFFIETVNSCRVDVAGNVRAFKGQIQDITDLHAFDLNAKEVLIDFHTPLDCFINATELIFVNITNSGNVFYLNEPTKAKILNSREGDGNLLLWEQ
jgi:hypothetical protein